MKCNANEHRWVSGGIDSDWVCDDCGLREDMPDSEYDRPEWEEMPSPEWYHAEQVAIEQSWREGDKS